MKLAEFMHREGLRDRRMGELIGLSESQISRLRRGISVPSKAKMPLIFSVSDGLVTPNDFVDLNTPLPSDMQKAS